MLPGRASPPASSASTRSEPTTPFCSGRRLCSARPTSTTSTSDAAAGVPGLSGPPRQPEGTFQMERVCFLGRIRPERLEEYRARHREVWPEMTKALQEAGWSNYSLFLTDDGLLVGYLETDEYAAAQRRMAQADVNARWQ